MILKNNNCTDIIIYEEEKLLEEKKFILKHYEKNYEIKIQLVRISNVPYIRIRAQEVSEIINYYYSTEMNEDDFMKQNNKLLKHCEDLQDIYKLIFRSFDENKISIKDIKENISFNLVIKEKITGEKFTFEISLKKKDCNNNDFIGMICNKINELEIKNNNLNNKVNELEEEKNRLNSKVNELETKNNTLNSKVNKLETKNNTLNSKVNELEKEKNNLTSKINELEEEKNNMKNEINGYNTEDSDSDSSSRSSTSRSLYKEWIASNKELISKACYEESSFDSLIDEIAKFSDSVEVRRELYEGIENTWKEKNVFGATVLNDGSFAISYAEHFD